MKPVKIVLRGEESGRVMEGMKKEKEMKMKCQGNLIFFCM
jgi:hypothetical protein